jgi:hypothetical protein
MTNSHWDTEKSRHWVASVSLLSCVIPPPHQKIPWVLAEGLVDVVSSRGNWDWNVEFGCLGSDLASQYPPRILRTIDSPRSRTRTFTFSRLLIRRRSDCPMGLSRQHRCKRMAIQSEYPPSALSFSLSFFDYLYLSISLPPFLS